MTLTPPPRRAKLKPQAWALLAFLLFLLGLLALTAIRVSTTGANGIPWWFPALIFLTPALFLTVYTALLTRAFKIQLKLLRVGLETEGVVTDVQYLRGAQWITYDFKKADGTKTSGRAAVPRDYRPAIGSDVPVLVLEDDESVNGIPPFTMVTVVTIIITDTIY